MIEWFNLKLCTHLNKQIFCIMKVVSIDKTKVYFRKSNQLKCNFTYDSCVDGTSTNLYENFVLQLYLWIVFISTLSLVLIVVLTLMASEIHSFSVEYWQPLSKVATFVTEGPKHVPDFSNFVPDFLNIAKDTLNTFRTVSATPKPIAAFANFIAVQKFISSCGTDMHCGTRRYLLIPLPQLY